MKPSAAEQTIRVRSARAGAKATTTFVRGTLSVARVRTSSASLKAQTAVKVFVFLEKENAPTRKHNTPERCGLREVIIFFGSRQPMVDKMNGRALKKRRCAAAMSRAVPLVQPSYAI